MHLTSLSTLLVALLLVVARSAIAGVTPEQILGEYWKDPLFGEAATEQTYYIDVLSDRLWPQNLVVSANKNIRFVFVNKSRESHLVAFSADPEALLADPEFTLFVKDEVFHSKKKVLVGQEHTHAASTVGDAQAIVKTISQRPTVFVVPDDQKEILIRFETVATVSLFCAMDSHHTDGFLSEIKVIESSD